MILTLNLNITRTHHMMSSGQRARESDSRVGPKHTDSTRGLSSKARDSKISRASRGFNLLTRPVSLGQTWRTQTRPVATLNTSHEMPHIKSRPDYSGA